MKAAIIKLVDVNNQNEDQCSIKEEVPHLDNGSQIEVEIDTDDGITVYQRPTGDYIHINPCEYELVKWL